MRHKTKSAIKTTHVVWVYSGVTRSPLIGESFGYLAIACCNGLLWRYWCTVARGLPRGRAHSRIRSLSLSGRRPSPELLSALRTQLLFFTFDTSLTSVAHKELFNIQYAVLLPERVKLKTQKRLLKTQQFSQTCRSADIY